MTEPTRPAVDSNGLLQPNLSSPSGSRASRSLFVCLSVARSQSLLGQNVDEIDNLDEVVSDLTLKVTVSLYDQIKRPQVLILTAGKKKER